MRDGNFDFRGVNAGEFTPVAAVLGLVLVAVTIAGHTAKQQLAHSPSVQIRKKRRGSLAEVDDADRTVECADKFVNKSFLRKVAHIQDKDHTPHDPTRPDPFTR